MKVISTTKLDEKYDQYDITTGTENFYVKSGDTYLLIHNSPAMYMGIDPVDNKFYVATKGIKNKPPNIITSAAEVMEKIKGPKDKVRIAFEELSKLQLDPNFIYQGDMLFAGQGDKKDEVIDGQAYITYTPNVITYAIPVDAKSKLYQKVNKAKFGIVFHTQYSFDKELRKETGEFKMTQVSQDLDYIGKQAEKIPSLYAETNIFIPSKDIKSVLKEMDVEKIKSDLKKFEASIPKFKKAVQGIQIIPKFLPRLQVYINRQLDMPNQGIFGDAKKGNKFNANKFLNDLKEYITQYWTKESIKVKTDKSKKRKLETAEEWNKAIDDNRKELTVFFSVYYEMIKIKNQLINTISSIKTELGNSFINDGTGYRTTSGEGMVLITSKNTTKLVDRIEFSALNRMLGQQRK